MRRQRQADFVPPTQPPMFLLRFLFKSVFLWILTATLGRFLPILMRLLRLLRW